MCNVNDAHKAEISLYDLPRAIEEMVRKGKERHGDSEFAATSSNATELHRDDEEEKVTFAMQNPSLGNLIYTYSYSLT